MSLLDPTPHAIELMYMDAVEFDIAHDRELEKGQPKDISLELDRIIEAHRNTIDDVREAYIEAIQSNDDLFWEMMMCHNAEQTKQLGKSTHQMFDIALNWIAKTLHDKGERE